MPWSKVHTEYSIHWVRRHPMMDCHPLAASLTCLRRPCCPQFSTSPQLRGNLWIESHLLSRLPPEPRPQHWPSPSLPAISFDHGLQVCTIMASKCMSKLAPWQSRSASLSSFYHGLKVNVKIRSITASKFAQSRPPSSLPNSLDHSFQVDL